MNECYRWNSIETTIGFFNPTAITTRGYHDKEFDSTSSSKLLFITADSSALHLVSDLLSSGDLGIQVVSHSLSYILFLPL